MISNTLGTLHLFDVDIDIWQQIITLRYNRSEKDVPAPTGHIWQSYYIWVVGDDTLHDPEQFAKSLSVELTATVFDK